MPGLTQVRVMLAVKKISEVHPTKTAPVKEIINTLKLNDQYVRNILAKLKKQGYLESPAYGCYVLTEKGEKLLSEVMKPA